MEQQALAKTLALSKQTLASSEQIAKEQNEELEALRTHTEELRTSLCTIKQHASEQTKKADKLEHTLDQKSTELEAVLKSRQTAVSIECQAGTSFVHVDRVAAQLNKLSGSAQNEIRKLESASASPRESNGHNSPGEVPADGRAEDQNKVQRWRPAFRVFDTEKHGWIDGQKLRRAFAHFGTELSDIQIEQMLPRPAGAPLSGGRTVIGLPQFADIMEQKFQTELWRMARQVAEHRLTQLDRQGSRLTELNFLARCDFLTYNTWCLSHWYCVQNSIDSK